MPIAIRSIDIGYGFTKFSHKEIDGTLKFSSFESNAVLLDDSSRLNANYEIFQIPVGDQMYAVGDDTCLLSNITNVKPTHDDFVHSIEYEALVKGALCAMELAQIDILVLGLPVHLFSQYREQVKAKWKGRIDLGNGNYVYIRNVIVVIQPMGAYRFHQKNDINLRTDNFSNRTLIIDPGWFTLDMLLIEGENPLMDSTDSFEMGVSGFLKRVAGAISRARNKNLPFPSSATLTQVDEWVRGGEIQLYGGNIRAPISPYLSAGNEYIYKAIQHIYSNVQERERISHIVMAGGAAQIYVDAVREAFPHINIIVPIDPFYANVRGFQIIGENAYKQHTTKLETA
jgi:plasmid segregation protein ParM